MEKCVLIVIARCKDILCIVNFYIVISATLFENDTFAVNLHVFYFVYVG